MAVPSLEEIRALPKIDQHAHLSGSITQQKLIQLLSERGNGDTFEPFDCRLDVSNALVKCFDYFDKVAKVVTDLATMKASALHVFDTFAAENTLYLELRTSPKAFKAPSGTTTKLQYLETIQEAIVEFQGYAEERFGFVMDIKILLSVNRGIAKSKEQALEQIDDILDSVGKFPELVVGVDVCGNPAAATAVPFIIPALLERKKAFETLPITYHLAEVESREECELVLANMAALNIRRFGHCCFLPDDLRLKILAGGIHSDGGKVGIELCPTSNLVTKEMKSLDEHHWPDWWNKSDKVLISINTDDTGLFSCDLTSEVHDMAKVFKLTREDIINVQRQALESSFHPDKPGLMKRFEAFLKKSEEQITEPPVKAQKV